MWKSLREIALNHPSVKIDEFILWASQPKNFKRFSITQQPGQTVLGSEHEEEMICAFHIDRGTKMEDTHEKLAKEVEAVRETTRLVEKNLHENEKRIMTLIQERCGRLGHKMEFMQIAGEGSYCTICGYRNYDND